MLISAKRGKDLKELNDFPRCKARGKFKNINPFFMNNVKFTVYIHEQKKTFNSVYVQKTQQNVYISSKLVTTTKFDCPHKANAK